MRRLIADLGKTIGDRLPMQFRVLHRQFLLRVIDLEALSIEADIPRFLGQFAGVLIMISFLHAFAVYVAIVQYPWRLEHYLISTMMLVAGLVTVVGWDAIFPDRRDIMVLAPLPIRPTVILIAKVCASATLLGIAILAVNTAPALVASLLLGGLHATAFGFFQVLAAYAIAMVAATLFLYCTVLTVQGIAALLLPRKAFLVFSSILQLGAFALFVSVYFLEPALGTVPELLAPSSRAILAVSPQFWFTCVFNQINGTLPPELSWLATRAWIALSAVLLGAGVSLLLSYLRTMKKTIEAPDLVPGASGLHFTPRRGGLRTAIALFSLRSILRSRQHRVALAFFLAIVFAIGLTCLRRELFTPGHEPVPSDFLISTLMMLSLTVFGVRAVFALPISLKANWLLQLTQLRPTAKYIAATRTTLFAFAVLPILIVTALLALNYRPWQHIGAHILMLALYGLLFVELALIRFDKVPFTCSWMPGKANVQVIFWGAVFIWIIFGALAGMYEHSALDHPSQFVIMAAVLLAFTAATALYNRARARTATLDFKDQAPELITTLGLLVVPEPRADEIGKAKMG